MDPAKKMAYSYKTFKFSDLFSRELVNLIRQISGSQSASIHMHILIVEDEEILSDLLKDKFEGEGWKVSLARDGEEAVESIQGKQSFDLVLLDLLLPRKDGFQVLKEIRSDKKYEKLPIIVLSNLGGQGDINEALQIGATDYFIKTQNSLQDILAKAKTYI